MVAACRLTKQLVAVALFTACSRADPTAPVPQLQRLTAAESAWRMARLTNYSFVGTVYCFCLDDYGSPKRVTVRSGAVTLITDSRNDRAYPVTWRMPVDSLFALIRHQARDLPARLEVTYDARLGYPRRISYGQQELDGGGVILIDSLRADQ